MSVAFFKSVNFHLRFCALLSIECYGRSEKTTTVFDCVLMSESSGEIVGGWSGVREAAESHWRKFVRSLALFPPRSCTRRPRYSRKFI